MPFKFIAGRWESVRAAVKKREEDMKKIPMLFFVFVLVLFCASAYVAAADRQWADAWQGVPWSDDKTDRMMDKMRVDFDSLLKDSFKPEMNAQAGFPVNVWDDKENIYVEATVPGRELKDISVNVEDGRVLTIEAKGRNKEEEKSRNFYRAEFFVGDLVRQVQLPYLVDTAGTAAKYENGILKLTLPKKEKLEKSKIKIEIK